MELILDTAVLIDVERQQLLLDVVVDDDDTVSIAAITFAELLHGVEMADDRNRVARQRFVDDIAGSIPVLSYDRRVARAHASLLAVTQRAGRRRGAHDLIIAATAATFGLTVVTSDPSGFVDLPGVALRSPDLDV